MSNLFDYLTWRGDLSFGNAPLCPVDALVFSMLAYMDFDGILPTEVREEPMRLADVAKAYFARPSVAGGGIDARHEQLLRTLAASVRYGGLRVLSQRKLLDRKSGVQFGAMAFLLPGQNIFVAFEGTDNTLVGWKEDFRMSYECPVPAQLCAAEYFREVAAAYPLRRLYAGGHSKGGNLAMYAAVYGSADIRTRIRTVYNLDGPGFCDDTLSSPLYLEIRDRIRTYLPQSSIVAVLLEHDTNYQIVKSSNKGLMQHDGYSWEVLGTEFVYATERTAFGKRTEDIVDRFVSLTSPERKRRFCEALFSILEATEQDTLAGIFSGKRQSLRSILSAYADLSDEMKTLLAETVNLLAQARRDVEKQEKDRLALAAAKTQKTS